MAKEIDTDGTWRIKANPITKECVRPYLGRQIDSDGTMGLDPDAVYQVYRPWDEISKPQALETFNGKPLRRDHLMLGIGEGLQDASKDPNAGGSLYNVRPAENGEHIVVADLSIWAKDIIDDIQRGIKELSLGYFCKYRKQDGVFEGDHYDVVQYDIEGNHIALVERGRMGKDVRVFDKAITFDSMEIPQMENITMNEEIKDEAAPSLKEQVGKLLEGASDEDLAKVKDLLSPTEQETGKDDEAQKDSCGGKDEDPNAVKDDEAQKDDAEQTDEGETDPEKVAVATPKDEEVKTEQDEEEVKPEGKDEDPAVAAATDPVKDEEEKAKDEEEKKAQDAMDAAIAEVTCRDALYSAVRPLTGAFDCSRMTTRKVAKYACDSLGIPCVEGAETAIIDAYIKGLNKAEMSFASAMDSAVSAAKSSPALQKYLNK